MAEPPIPSRFKESTKPVVKASTPRPQASEEFVSDIIPKHSAVKEKIFTFNVSGEPDSGKSHLLRTFPDPIFLDTEGKAWVVLEKFNPIPWKRVKSFDDIRKGILWALDRPEIKTIVVDSAADLSDLAGDEFMSEKNVEKIFPVVQYKKVYDKIDPLILDIQEAGKYFACSSRRKDEYLNDNRTGRRIIDSYKKFPWDLMISVEIVFGIKDVTTGKIMYSGNKFARVEKNNFFGMDMNRQLNFMKPYLFDVSFEGICQELLNPWHGAEGVPIGEENATIIKDAGEWIAARKKP
jgi:hypothetical protein